EIEKKEVKKEAVDPKPEEKVEEKPEIVVAPRCTMELVENEETGGVDVVYSGACGGKRIREVAGKIALDGVRFRPISEEKPEEKKISEMTKEERKKDFDEKVLACERDKEPESIEGLEKRLVDLKKQREKIDAEPSAVPEPAEGSAEPSE
ncbi:unnamed protein product, partial [marine sediment metagenome]